jgi:hypothetical protein
MKRFIPFLLPLLFSCSGNPINTGDRGADATNTLTVSKDSVMLPAFNIVLQLSKAAEEKLASMKETVIVDADLSGIPKDTTLEAYRETGEFAIGNYRVELSSDRTARFDHLAVSKADFEKLADPDVEVLVNIYSGRRSSPNNILDCEFLQKNISAIRGQQIVLKGKLIGE